MRYKETVFILLICLLLMLPGVIRNEEDAVYVEQEKTTTVQADSKATPLSVVVYRTEYGTKYHQEDCRYLRKSKIEIKISSAEKLGLEPCSVCKP